MERNCSPMLVLKDIVEIFITSKSEINAIINRDDHHCVFNCEEKSAFNASN